MIEETKYNTNRDEKFTKKVVRNLATLVAGIVIVGSLGGCLPLPYHSGGHSIIHPGQYHHRSAPANHPGPYRHR